MKMFTEKQFRDIKILIGEESTVFFAHKVVLWARSGFFRATLDLNMLESHENVIRIKHINKEVFSKILEYIYLGKMETDNIGSILEASTFLQITTLNDDCVKVILNNITGNNIFIILDLSINFTLEKIEKKCIELIQKKGFQLFKDEKYVQTLSKQALIKILKHRPIYNMNELQLMKGKKEIYFFK